MNVLSKKARLKSLLSGLLCVVMLLSQIPMVFAADADGSAGDTVTPVVDEVQTPQTVEPQTEVPQTEDSDAGELVSLFADDEVEITTAQELADLAANVKSGTYSVEKVTLKNDIDLSVLYEGDDAIKTWTPIGTASSPFTGEFDGGGFTVSGMTITGATTGNQALFGVVSGAAYIYDLTVSGSVDVVGAAANSTMNNEAGVIGSIAAGATGVVVENVTSKVTVNGGKSVGGIVGLIDTGAVATLADCVNEGGVTATPGTNSTYGKNIGVGGIVGTLLSVNAGISGCSNSGAVKNLSATYWIQGSGGIVGYMAGGTVEDCTNSGSVTGASNSYLGGVAGYVVEGGSISGCTNSGDISGGRHQGGIAGYNYGAISDSSNSGTNIATIYGHSGGIAGINGTSGTISGCVNTGNVIVDMGSDSMNYYTGGVVGSNVGAVDNCENKGNVTASIGSVSTTISGLAGVVGTNMDGTVYRSGNSGKVSLEITTDDSNTKQAAGVVGYLMAGEVRFCWNTGDVAVTGTGAKGAAGVAGYVAGTLRGCWSTGNVSTSGTSTDDAGYAPGGIFRYVADGGLVQDCYATGKLLLSDEASAVMCSAIGYAYGGTVENCLYYNTEYTETELARVQMISSSAATVSNCYAVLGTADSASAYSVGGTVENLTVASFADADGVVAALGEMWELKTGAAYPTILVSDEYEPEITYYTLTLTRLEADTAAAGNAALTYTLMKDGSPISVSGNSYSEAQKNDQIQLSITVPANSENTLLLVSASDSACLSAATVKDNTYIYTITMPEGDLEIQYILVDKDKAPSLWYTADPTATEFTITKPEELAFLSQLTAGTATDAVGSPIAAYNFSGKTVKLGADLDLSNLCWPAVEADVENGVEAKAEQSWTPITGFSGTFDGDGHTISNLYVNTGEAGYAGLFVYGKVNNLTVENATVITTGDYAGAIAAGSGISIVNNCTVRNSTVSGASYVGGVLGRYVTVDCMVENTTVTGTGNYVGGVIGYYIDKADLTGNQAVDITVSGADYVGGVAGGLSFSQNGAQTALANYVLGDSTVSGANYVGGVFGQQAVERMGNGSTGGFVSTAKVTATGDYVGGIAGKGTVSYAIYYNWDAENGRPNVSTTSETATHVGWLSGNDADSSMPMGGSSEGVSVSKSYYLSNERQTNADGSVGLTADTFLLDEMLYLLQGSSKISWELEEGTLFPLPYLPTEDHPAAATLYKLSLQPLTPVEGCSVSISPFAEGGEGYAYTLYQTADGLPYTYATANTAIPLNVTLPQGKAVTFYPASAVTVTEATEDTPASYTVNLTADTLLEYSFPTPVAADTSWYTGDTSEYTISTEAQLRGLAQLVNAGNSFEGITLKLGDDITLVGGDWTPIGVDADHPFSGTFDGGNHTIDGLYLYNYAGTYAGLFGYLSAASAVSNLTVEGTMSSADRYIGGVAGYSAGTLSDITSAVNVGLSGTFTSTATSGYIGGIVGYLDQSGALTGSVFTGTASTVVLNSGYDYLYMGGLAGVSAGVISGGENRGQLKGIACAGGIVGSNFGTVADCLNTADLSGILCGKYNDSSMDVASFAGGVVGRSNTGSTIIRCGNEGKIDVATYAVGGVVGCSYGAVVDQVYNRGEIIYTPGASVCYGGGVVGYLAANSTLSNSYNTGSVTWVGTGNEHSYTGGLVGYGYNSSTVVVRNCYNTVTGVATGTLDTATTKTGGILGYNISTPTLDNCYNLDTVTEGNVVAAKVTALSESDLKAGAALLGDAFIADLADEDSMNGGYPVLWWEVDPSNYTITVDSALASVELEELTVGEDGTYIVRFNKLVRFTVTPDSGYGVSTVTANGETLTADADGVYTVTVTGDTEITVTVEALAVDDSSRIERIISSVAAGTQNKDAENSTYDETLDFNDDGKNNLLDILNILLRQETEETEELENSGSDDVQIDNPDGEEALSNEPVENE